ncbi:hypothetical protein J4450_08545 [Candidatus Micrarchaeota archaeon]|nr:hypothetical protein [Candidatus Micrarchaeota archaeon]
MGLKTALFGTKPPELTVCPYHKVMQRMARFFGLRIIVEGPQTAVRGEQSPNPIRPDAPKKTD